MAPSSSSASSTTTTTAASSVHADEAALTTSSTAVSTTSSSSYNIFRDSSIRYLGYANEVGESFRYQLPHLVRPSYVLAFGYCCADAASSGWHVWNDNSYSNATTTTNDKNNARMYQTALATADTLLWQSLASVMIPGATINIIVKATRMVVQSSTSSTSSNRLLAAAATVSTTAPLFITKWLPTSLGLLSIPFIIHPIDAAVDYALDNTTRRWWPLSAK